MSDPIPRLAERIRHHYQNITDLANFTGILRRDISNFEQDNYIAELQNIVIPDRDSELDDLAEQIARGLVEWEFSHFVRWLDNIECNTIETTLENLVDTLDTTFNNLYDASYDPDQLYMSFDLRTEIRRRKNSIGPGIDFGVTTIDPTIVRELGKNKIIFSNTRCAGKTYPNSIERQITVSHRMGNRFPEIICSLVHRLDIRNQNLMAKIVVTDFEP